MNNLAGDSQKVDVLLGLLDDEGTKAIINRFESSGYEPRFFLDDQETHDGAPDRSSKMSVLVISNAWLSKHFELTDQWLTQYHAKNAIIGIDDEKDGASDLAAMSDVILSSSEAADSVGTVTRAVLNYHAKVNELAAEVKQRTSAIGNIVSGSFGFRTLDEARNLSTMLALACPRSDVAAVGLLELLVNAVEHGNLGIGWDLKSKLLAEGRWTEEIDYRLNWKPFSDRVAHVDFRRHENHIEIAIEDEGTGFDFTPFLDGTNRKKSPYHGRGIFFAREMAFDAVEYNGCGNKVCVRMNTSKDDVIIVNPDGGQSGRD